MLPGSADSPSPPFLDPFLQKTADLIRQAHLLQRGDSLLLAVSGGIDSMVMMDVLLRLRPLLGLGECQAVYLDHGQRPSQTPHEAELVLQRAQAHGIEAFSLPLFIPRRSSFQDAARQARRACLEDLARTRGLSWIATGHHRDDQAETLLQRIFRGTGPRGLSGIWPKQGRFLHPLLWASRPEILNFARQHSIPWLDDPTNESSTYRRNQIRHQLLPTLEAEYDPKIRSHLARLASLIRTDEIFFSQLLSDALRPPLLRRFPEGLCLDLRLWDQLPEPLRWRSLQSLVSEISGHELTAIHLEHLLTLLQHREGEQIASLPSSLEGLRSYHRLWLFPPSRLKPEDMAFSLEIPGPGTFSTPLGDLVVSRHPPRRGNPPRQPFRERTLPLPPRKPALFDLRTLAFSSLGDRSSGCVLTSFPLALSLPTIGGSPSRSTPPQTLDDQCPYPPLLARWPPDAPPPRPCDLAPWLPLLAPFSPSLLPRLAPSLCSFFLPLARRSPFLSFAV